MVRCGITYPYLIDHGSKTNIHMLSLFIISLVLLSDGDNG